MISFSKQTTPAEEDAIERTATKLRDMGFGADTIVYRNQVDVALAAIALHALNHDGTVKGMDRVVTAMGEHQRFAVIGAKTLEDGQALRERVNKLREMIAPAFGVTPEEPKPAAPAKHQPLRP